jgi:hypothetical protein
MPRSGSDMANDGSVGIGRLGAGIGSENDNEGRLSGMPKSGSEIANEGSAGMGRLGKGRGNENENEGKLQALMWSTQGRTG